MVFKSRSDAGRLLGEQVARLSGWTGSRAPRAVVGIPGGGIPVAYEVARYLKVPLDIVLVRRITAPGNPELTIGAVSEDGAVVSADTFLSRFAPQRPRLSELARETEDWLSRRASLLRGGHAPVDPTVGDVVLVDDGMVTGATMRAAVASLRHRGAVGMVLAVPVAAPRALHRLRPLVDETVCPDVRDIHTVGAWYLDHRPIPDTEIGELLKASRTTRDPRCAA
ncbi:phosphoribosyltransferase family protein [Streptomyces sp. S.PB5]|uniref:phosphoribosyltransferase n=1 Tax=Streptomyces sp. S.PB5 TaxID=3020844 RepID=UPI0025B0142B|nr:phosphoribosyltransferase family protein [Streptomyces sp. S.PB5]MDN3028974.1 phosphoribosyltransferase family protein [Streptomyces sp. S.PB5]